MLIAKVVPQTRLPRGLIFFDYIIPEPMTAEIKPGSLVVIPFRGRQITGVVFDIADSTLIAQPRLKKIQNIYDKKIFVPENLLETFKWLSDEILLPPSTMVKAFIPDIPKRDAKPKNYLLAGPRQPLKIPKAATAQIVNTYKDLKRLDSDHNIKTVLCNFHETFEKEALIYKLIEKFLKEQKNTILVAPYINDVSRWLNLLSGLVNSRIDILHGELTKNEYWQVWKSVKVGEIKVLIGTPRAIFAPFDRIDRIIFDRPEVDDFKQSDQNPRYDSREVAVKRAAGGGEKIFYFSQVPRVQDYFLGQNLTDMAYLSTQAEPNNFEDVKLINMKTAGKDLVKFFSDELINALESNLKRGKKAFILVNQKGFAKSLICQDCGQTIDCPDCKIPAVYHQKNLICRHCQNRQAVPIICPRCGGASLKPVGYGSERIKDSLKNYFKDVIVESVSADNPKISSDAQIIVGTTLFVHRYLSNIQDIGLVAIASIDNLLYLADFNSGEKIMQILSALMHFCQSKMIPLFIQTYNADHVTIKSALSDDYISFYNQEIGHRKILNYPPYKRLLKLIVSDNTYDNTYKKAVNLISWLKTRAASNFEVLGPLPVFKEYRNFKSHVIIKYAASKKSFLKKILSGISPEIIIDFDPVSLL